MRFFLYVVCQNLSDILKDYSNKFFLESKWTSSTLEAELGLPFFVLKTVLKPTEKHLWLSHF